MTIYQLDGPSKAYFEFDGHGHIWRGTYESVYVHGPSKEVVEDKWDELFTTATEGAEDKLIVWRLRPKTEYSEGLFTLRARLWVSGFSFSSLTPINGAQQYVFEVK